MDLTRAEKSFPPGSLLLSDPQSPNLNPGGKREERIMKSIIQLKTPALPLLITLTLACIVLLPAVQAVVPAPDGGYPGGNTAEGQNALFSLTSGGFNTAIGLFSLRALTNGKFNTGVGAGTLLLNNADGNTAIGAGALLNNISGPTNTATGAFALFNNTIGDGNTAIGANALLSNTTTNGNTAIGSFALINSTGAGNTAIGYGAGSNVSTANGVICIGHNGQNVTATTWIENVYGATTQSGTTAQVIVSDDGQLGTIASSERFKKDIATMDKASEAILSLRPVTFHYKTDAKGIPQFGLIAEEVAKMNPALVLPDKDGKPYSVRYDAVNAMLLNEFLKEHRKVQEQDATIAQVKSTTTRQEATIAQQQKQIEALTEGLQKVSAQLELSKPATQTAGNQR
ncbi:MAG: hypothetical protein DMF00_10515 [Verrucomicrobia bacterium]|nr:MAG: hypothetical protein DMF00_10515 [Verrucomicrobiota bacterium]